MKCCVSQTTSIVPDVKRGGAGDESSEVAALFEAQLVRLALGPVAESLGFYGDVVTSAIARAVAGRAR